jgi:Tfp pilus assembly protein PilZ
MSNMSEEKQMELLTYLSEKTRRFPRRKCVMAVDCEAKGSTSRDYVLDVSRGGVFLETTRLLCIGEKVRLTFTPQNIKKPLEITGEVVWQNIHGVGIEFDAAQPGQDKLLVYS